jgi:hypothetical protein
MVRMQTRSRYIHGYITALGIWAVIMSGTVIFHAISQLPSWEGDGLFEVAMVVLMLGILQATGGSCLALRNVRFGKRAS